MSRIVDFYRGSATDVEGRMLSEMWNWSDEDLEIMHDFIQWMFPMREPSQYNPDAPLLTEDDIAPFRKDDLLQSNLRKSFVRILAFLGLAVTETGTVVESPQFAERVPEVWGVPNHNWLRITRILKSLFTLGLESESRHLYDRLDAIYSSRRFPITADTFDYWTEEVR
jgi:hypothetical protein